MKFDINYLSSIVVALLLCGSSAALIAWHIRAWRRLQGTEIGAGERNFRRRQYRRRMQTSAMLGVLGVAIFIGQLLMIWTVSQLFLVIYWSGVVLLVFWVALLALLDMAATSFFYGREKNENLVEHARLQGELRRAQETEAKTVTARPARDISRQ